MERVFVFLLLVGCFPRIGADNAKDPADADTDADSDADTDADTDADVGTAPSILTISSTDGSTRGGQLVEITGADFTESTHVWFGDDEAEIQELGRERLSVLTPEARAGTVDVAVGRDEAEDLLADSFTYWTDHTDDTEALALWYYFSFSDGDTSLEGMVLPIAPAPVEYWEYWGGEMDACDVEGNISLSSWDVDVALVNDAGDRYPFTAADGTYDYSDEAASWTTGESLGLSVSGGTDLPDFDTDSFFSTPASFRLTRPAVGDGDVDFHTPDDLSVAWTGTGEDFVVLWLHGAEADLYCVVEDDGAFTIDGAFVTRFSAEYVQFSAMRFRVGSVELAHDGGTIQGAGMYMTAGWLVVY